MGMFDVVQFEMPCPKCGERVTDWQSKSGECSMDVLLPHVVRNFYTSCDACKQWIEFTDGRMVCPDPWADVASKSEDNHETDTDH